MYVPGQSFLHRMCPAAKILIFLLSFAIVVTFSHPAYLGALILGVILLFMIGRILLLIGRIRVLLFLLFIFPSLLWTVYYDGVRIFWRFLGLEFTWEGLKYGVGMGLRLDCMLLIGLLLLGTTKIEDFSAGLNYLGLPYRMSFSLCLAFRLVPLFFAAFLTISQAQQSRGFNIGTGGLLRRINSSIPLLIPVFIAGLRRTDQLAVALEVKGFGRSSKRTSIYPVVMSRVDWLCVAGSLLLMLAGLVLRSMGLGQI
jgi:energy-coupling factor transport system permease protein